MNRDRLILTLIGCILSFATSDAHILINEIMQSNVTCITDDLNDFPDSWVELYNTSSSDVNLKGYALGDTENFDTSYSLPELVIQAHGFSVIFLDKVGRGVHADFRLDSGKGKLWLFDNKGKSIDVISYDKMPSFDVSYGRLSSNLLMWGYQLEPTPGRPNTSNESASVINATPVFSTQGGLRDTPFDLVISLPNDTNIPKDARIAISTDGSWPTITVESPTTVTIKSSTVVRARIVSKSQIAGSVVTHSYIYHPEPTNLDVISIATDSDYLYSATFGIFEGSDGLTVEDSNNWRRPINIEYFAGADHHNTINQIGETKVKGNSSRRFPQKSMAVYAHKRFGHKKFNTTGIWVDKPEVTEVKSFELRNSGQRFMFDHLCDQFAHRIGGQGSKHLDWSAYRPVICYLNGKYHGIYDFRERCNDDNIEANYNGLEDIDMVTDWIELETGDSNAVADLQRDFGADNVSFDSLCKVMDVDGFVEMFILQWVLGNTDFPRHNIVSWRYQSGDRRWHWLLKDLDCIGVDGVNGDYIEFVNGNMQEYFPSFFSESGRPFYIFLNSVQGRALLIPRLMVAMGDYLREDRALNLLDQMASEIAPEYARHLDRFFPQSDKYTYQYWEEEIEKRKNEIIGRSAAIIRQLQEHYGYSDCFSLSINNDGDDAVCISGLELRHPGFSGEWFHNLPLEIESPSAKSWSIREETSEGELINSIVFGPKLNIVVDNPSVRNVEISIEKDPDASITPSVYSPAYFRIYNIAGTLIRESSAIEDPTNYLSPGLYIIQSDQDIRKIVVN